MWGRLALLLLGGLMALVLNMFVRPPIEEWLLQKKEPARLLEQAASLRQRMTERDLSSAADKYSAVAARSPALAADAYCGLARTYADWATLRFWRGLSRADYPDKARTNALKADQLAPARKHMTGIALAYAYASSEAELRASAKDKTRTKTLELLNAGQPTQDLEYLAWHTRATNAAESFPAKLSPAALFEMRILIEVATHYTVSAAREADDAGKRAPLSRAEEFLNRAAILNPESAEVAYARGYLAAARGNDTGAQTFYLRAVDLEPSFPIARNNLGITYAAEGKYSEAKRQFEAAILTDAGAPIMNQRHWLHNLGEAYLEMNSDEKACRAWQRAAEMVTGNEDTFTFLGIALCSYITGGKADAVRAYGRAARLGEQIGLDLRAVSAFEAMKAGPRETEIGGVLISMAGNSPAARPDARR